MTDRIPEIAAFKSEDIRVDHVSQRVAAGLPVVIGPEDGSWKKDALLIPQLNSDAEFGAVVTFLPTVDEETLKSLDLSNLDFSDDVLEGLEPLALSDEETALLVAGELAPEPPEEFIHDEISRIIGSIAVERVEDGKVEEEDGMVYTIFHPTGLSGIARVEFKGERQEAVFDALFATQVKVTGMPTPRVQYLIGGEGAVYEVIDGVPIKQVKSGKAK